MRGVAYLLLLGAMLVMPAGCDEDLEDATPTLGAAPADPRDTIPPERLYGATAEENLRIVPVEIDVQDLPDGLDSLQVAVLSDFQLGLWPGNERVAAAAVQRAVETGADVFVLLGDYLARGDSTDALRRVLAPLRGKPVYAVLGDRDIRSDSVQVRVVRALKEVGAQVLRNERARLVIGEDTAYIGGVDPDLLSKSWGDQEWVMGKLAGGGSTPLVLSHHATFAVAAPPERIPLVLSGHTVCGDTEVAGTPRLSWLRSATFQNATVPESDRLFVVKQNPVFVTCGTGYSFIPARFGSPPEVALVTLRSASAETGTVTPQQPNLDSLIEVFEPRDSARADTAR